jgi:NitT/TauT family transport system substrate-binding protein
MPHTLGKVVLIFAGLAALIVCGLLLFRRAPEGPFPTPPAIGSRPPGRELTIAMDLWPGYYPLIAAHTAGLAEKRGVRLTFAFPQDTHRMIADFAGGRYDGVCASLGDMILAHQRDPDIRMILCSDESAGADQIIGKASLADSRALAGSRIGTTLGGFGELLVRRFLLSQGVPPHSVNLVNADAADCVTLLNEGRLDAAHTWEPYAIEGRKSGYTLLYSSKSTSGLILDGLMVHSRLIAEDRATVLALTATWFEGLAWWKQNRTEGDRQIREFLRNAGLPDLEIQLEGIILHDAAANRRLFLSEAPGGLDASAREFISFFLERRSLTSSFDPQRMLDGTLIP